MSSLAARTTVGLVLCAAVAVAAPEERGGRGKGGPDQPSQNSTCNDVPAHPLDLILARPTQDSVTISVLAYQDMEGWIAYGTERGQLTRRTPRHRFSQGEPVEVVISALKPDTRYFYQFRGGEDQNAEGAFHTQRAPGAAFTFTITADSHLDDRVSAGLYQRTLANALADAPDFHIDLGDTFMTEKHDSRASAARQYLAQRFYFGQFCHSAPLFLVPGNHDGESPRGRGSDADGLAVWSNLMRKRYFPNPVPDDFYSGNAAKHPEAGLLQDYYAWQWGDALFVVLDPFWFTQKQRGKSDNWKRSIGADQYQWLQRTLETSKAKLKFIFIHHLAGGADEQGRGGAEAAGLFEWGGKNPDGTDGFKENRPGWPAPIHHLLVRNHVAAVFHGHDHLYAKQDLDGTVYQEVPQPGTPGTNKLPRTAEEYGYTSGVIMSSPGHLRVRVAPEKATVEYVRAWLPEDERSDRRNAAVGHSYVIPSYNSSITTRKPTLNTGS
ncbi:MAG: metallophosphoesterase [Pirellulales bacterium]|nr:metallophosphoesterase [Pirellulales bacterium]